MQIQVLSFDEKRDEDLYLEGDLAAFKESFPGITVTADMLADMRSSIRGIGFSEDVVAFTAIANDQAIGFVVVSMQWFYNLPQGYIDSIYVKASFRKNGCGRLLQANAEEWAKSKGARSIKLEVSISNRSAIEAYKNSGFSSTRVQMERAILL